MILTVSGNCSVEELRKKRNYIKNTINSKKRKRRNKKLRIKKQTQPLRRCSRQFRQNHQHQIKMARYRYLALFSVLVIYGCNTTKYLGPGQKLYTSAQIKITDKDVKKSVKGDIDDEMEALLRPLPNGKVLGIRMKLWLYDRYKTPKKTGLKHFLMSKGEPPVLISSVDLEQNSAILQNRLQNEGYFLAQVSGDTVG